MKTKYKYLYVILAVLAVIIYFIQPFYTWFAADDFCYIGKVQHEGIISGMFHEYMHWDGRSISLTFPVCRLGLYFGKYWMGPLLGSVLLMMAGYLILKIANFKFKNKAEMFFTLAFITAVLWLCLFNILAQTLYWTTGIGYNMDVLMLLFAYWLFRNWSNKKWQYIVAVPAFFYAGTASPNGVLALLLVIGIHFLKELWIDKKVNYKRYLFAVGLVMLAFIVVIKAPGNANRLNGFDKANFTHIWTIYFNIKTMFTHLWEYNTALLWMLIILGFAGSWYHYREIVDKDQNKGTRNKILAFIYVNRWIIAAKITFIFFLPFPGLHAPRTNIQFVIFGVLYALMEMKYLPWKKLTEHASPLNKVMALVMFIFIVAGTSQAFDARYCKGQLAARAKMFEESKGKDVVLTATEVIRPPATRRFEDVSDDSTYWLNQCVAQRYGLKSIKMDENKGRIDYYKSKPAARQMNQ